MDDLNRADDGKFKAKHRSSLKGIRAAPKRSAPKGKAKASVKKGSAFIDDDESSADVSELINLSLFVSSA